MLSSDSVVVRTVLTYVQRFKSKRLGIGDVPYLDCVISDTEVISGRRFISYKGSFIGSRFNQVHSIKLLTANFLDYTGMW